MKMHAAILGELGGKFISVSTDKYALAVSLKQPCYDIDSDSATLSTIKLR